MVGGFLIAAVCPGAPYGPSFYRDGKRECRHFDRVDGDPRSVSAFVAPAMLYWLLPVVSGDGNLEINALRIVSTLLISQIVPLCVGLAVRHRNLALATKLQGPANRLGTLLNVVAIGADSYRSIPDFAAIRLKGFVGIFLLVAAATSIGSFPGGPGSDNRKAMGLTSGSRDVGVSPVVVTSSYSDTVAVTSALACAMFRTILLALIATLCNRGERRSAELLSSPTAQKYQGDVARNFIVNRCYEYVESRQSCSQIHRY